MGVIDCHSSEVLVTSEKAEGCLCNAGAVMGTMAELAILALPVLIAPLPRLTFAADIVRSTRMGERHTPSCSAKSVRMHPSALLEGLASNSQKLGVGETGGMQMGPISLLVPETFLGLASNRWSPVVAWTPCLLLYLDILADVAPKLPFGDGCTNPKDLKLNLIAPEIGCLPSCLYMLQLLHCPLAALHVHKPYLL